MVEDHLNPGLLLPTTFKNANTQILISLPDAQLRISQGVLDFASGRPVNLTKTNTNYFAAVWAHHCVAAVVHPGGCEGSGNRFLTTRRRKTC